MSTFTLAISCLTTSNLPWFMDLTFQVPMQYCSLQHRTLLLSAVTSTTGYCFCFGSIPSFFLELFLHWSPEAYWAPTDLGTSSFSILSFCHGPRRSVAERSYSSSKVGAAAERSYPVSEVSGSGPECQAATAQEQPRGVTSLQYSCLENPMNSMKRQNDRILKEELPRYWPRYPICYWRSVEK